MRNFFDEVHGVKSAIPEELKYFGLRSIAFIKTAIARVSPAACRGEGSIIIKPIIANI